MFDIHRPNVYEIPQTTGMSADILNSTLLLASVGLIVLSTVFLSLEIRLSLKAIKVPGRSPY